MVDQHYKQVGMQFCRLDWHILQNSKAELKCKFANVHSALHAEKQISKFCFVSKFVNVHSALQAEKQICKFCFVSKILNSQFCIHNVMHMATL